MSIASGKSGFASVIVIATMATLGLWGCSPETVERPYYMVAQSVKEQSGFVVTITIVRQFEKKPWCEARAETYSKMEGLTAKCTEEGAEYDPMLRGEGVGKWYLIRRYGRLSPSVVSYDFVPPLPDELMVAQLKKLEPHTIQFAALHRAPAEVSIISPDGHELQY